MVIKTNGISINVISKSDLVPDNKIPVLFLHGFTGSAKDWSSIASSLNSKYFPIAVDLLGHGNTTVPNKLDSYSTEAYTHIIQLVLDHFKILKVVLVGYSMGGRTALSFTVKNNEKIIGLILESSTAGIEDDKERAIRIETDSMIADKIMTVGIDSFINYWMDIPFFRSLKLLGEKEYSELVLAKKQNSPLGLANSLLGFSTGKMPSLWSNLSSLKIPTLLIAGSLDRKFLRINKEMNQLIPNSDLEIMNDCGHNTHLENREEFLILVNNFLSNLEDHET